MIHALALAALLQEAEPPSQKALRPAASAWTFQGAARLDLDYDSNVWRLDGDDEDRLLDDLPGDQISGRFDDMESIEDWIVSPRLRAGLKGPGLLGRTLEAFAEIEWREHAVNSARSHLRLRAGAEEPVGKDGRLSLDLEVLPDVFNKNYLADATDFTGGVSASERVYDAGAYREIGVVLTYRHRFVKVEGFTLDGLFSAGLRDRSYDSPFGERDESAPPVELGVRVRSWERVRWIAGVRIEPIDSPTRRVVLLLDEPAFGADLNGDGDAVDVNARSEQTVDRTRLETSLLLGVEVEVLSMLTAELGWTRTWKEWSSDEPFDVSHRDRSDTTDKVELSLKLRFDGPWEGRLGWERTVQDTDRPSDPGGAGETTDYERNVFSMSVIFRW